MVRLILTFAMLSIGALVGCGSSGSGPSSSFGPNSSADEIDSVQVSNINGVYKIRYQFEKDFCNTETHTVTGYSESEVVGNFCTALSNNDLNHRCARDLRKKHFKEYCGDRDASGFRGINRHYDQAPHAYIDDGDEIR